MPTSQNSNARSLLLPTGCALIAVAASAGGLAALIQLLACLPAGFPVPIVVVQHLDPHRTSLMAEILARSTRLAVKLAEHGDRLTPATVYVAPPDRHLLVNADGTLALSSSEQVHFVRPSADMLFRSVAASFGARAVAVVLTGTGFDGADGVRSVKQRGGTVIVQSRESAQFFGMPGSAIETGSVDAVLPLAAIAQALIDLTTTTQE